MEQRVVMMIRALSIVITKPETRTNEEASSDETGVRGNTKKEMDLKETEGNITKIRDG